MNNTIDKKYTDLLQDILDNGTKKETRNGGTISVFGRQIRHSMKDGFPLLTTKKMPFKTIVTELLWFLRGDTNIKYLLDNDCHIWVGDTYKNYTKDCILFDEMSDSRMTRTIIGCPSSTDITSYIDPESDWGAVDYLTGEKIKYEDCDNGVIYFNQKMVKIPSLKQIGVIGLRCESLYRALDESSFIYNQKEFINKIKTDDEFAKTWGSLGKIYGKQWRSWETSTLKEQWGYGEIEGHPNGGKQYGKFNTNVHIDQIQNLINDLKTNPDSRRLLVNSWNVGELSEMVLPPCHYGFQVYTRELSLDERLRLVNYDKEKFNSIDEWITWYNNEPNEFYYMGINYTKDTALTDLGVPTRAISLMWNQRSVDVPLGLPFNIASYGLLLEIIAKMVNMVPDELIGNLGDCHIYSNQIEGVKEQIGREPFELPTLKHMKTDDFYKSLSEDLSLFTHLDNSDFQIEGYKSHPKIVMPLSN